MFLGLLEEVNGSHVWDSCSAIVLEASWLRARNPNREWSCVQLILQPLGHPGACLLACLNARVYVLEEAAGRLLWAKYGLPNYYH